MEKSQSVRQNAPSAGQDPRSRSAPDETYRTSVLKREFTFTGLKALLGAADCSKAGDRNAGLAAHDRIVPRGGPLCCSLR